MEAQELRRMLSAFLDTEFTCDTGLTLPVGNFKWGVYAFYDYDGEPIYVGQTNESLRTRIRRHLTNQRTDAVAMSVLDPLEVSEIEIWPLGEFQTTPTGNADAKFVLNGLENTITRQAIAQSEFGAILNEKDPLDVPLQRPLPTSFRKSVLSDQVKELRSHPDTRIARRASTIARLSQIISERKVQNGLRRVLVVQAKRLTWLANRRYESLGGDSTVPVESTGE